MTGKRKSIFDNPRYSKIVGFMFEHQKRNKYPASIREIGKKAEIQSTSLVNYYLDRLEDLGYIKRIPKKSRGATLTDTGDMLARTILGLPQDVCPHCGSPLKIPVSLEISPRQTVTRKMKTVYVN